MKTLTASLAPILVGSSLAFFYKSFSFSLMIWTFLSSVCIQIGTNLFNDVLDFQKGVDHEGRLGPLRVSQNQFFTEKQVFFMAMGFFLLSMLFSIPLLLKGGLLIFLIGVSALTFGYLYTGTKWALSYTGLAEPFVILFFGIISVGGMFFLHTGSYHFEVFLAGLQVGLVCTTLLVINNLRDIECDRKASKKTLAVRLGFQKARFELLFLYVLAFILQIFWIAKGYSFVFSLSFLLIPFCFHLVYKVFSSPPSKKYNAYLAESSLFHILFCTLLSLEFLIPSGGPL